VWWRLSDGERGTETWRTSTRSPNDRKITTGCNTTQNGAAELATVEHGVGDLREISSQVQENKEEQGVCKALSSVAAKPYRLSIHQYCTRSFRVHRGIYTRNNPPRWVWDKCELKSPRWTGGRSTGGVIHEVFFSSRASFGFLHSLQSNDCYSLLGSQNDVPFVALES
jgi:hypothetical protein